MCDFRVALEIGSNEAVKEAVAESKAVRFEGNNYSAEWHKEAKKRGYVTYDELNEVLPSEEVTSEQIEDTLAMLSEMGINVRAKERAAFIQDVTQA